MIDYLSRTIARDLATFEAEVNLFPDDEALWRTLPGVANAAGSLAQHVCGNLRHFVGATLGGTGYVRDRDREFRERGLSRALVAANLRETAGVVAATLPRLSPDALGAAYPFAVGGVVPRTGDFLLHLGAHLAFHLGQAGYLRRALTGDATSTSPLSPGVLAPA